MDIIQPKSERQLELRDQLLQSTLREPKDSISIVSEYPTVLSHHHTKYSFCVEDKNAIIAHLNLWPRRVTNSAKTISYQVGLIGNVATHESHRGKGIMRDLLNSMENQARNHGLDALILWSDLEQFYYGLGYQYCSEEIRFHIGHLRPPKNHEFQRIDYRSIDQVVLAKMIEKRQRTQLTIDRSIDEFRSLLSIPDTHLFMKSHEEPLSENFAFGIYGKGCDMRGVVHEWGVSHAADLQDLISSIQRETGHRETLLLSPIGVDKDFFSYMEAISISVNYHPMCYVKFLNENIAPEELGDLFIWGLDSI
ncbi:MAG: GNAT family N-acetyltransferase [Pseudobacteriovorax sp.]|nr:GNAT family N-acetyltransferase [Pseudobacteriovorax sp.]